MEYSTPQERPKGTVEANTHDLTSIKILLNEMVDGLQKGPKSRERSLVITKLEEAAMWALRAQATDTI